MSSEAPNNGETLPQTEALQLGSTKGTSLDVGARGFALNTLDEAWKFCTFIASSGLAPKGMETPQKILYALELGFEVGLPPLAALQSVAVINGRASLYGDVMLGLCQSKPYFDHDTFEEDWIRDKDEKVIGAYCIARRLPNGKPRRWDFTIDDAKTAKLWGKEGPWTTTPKRMMQMRARAFTLRDVFPDALKGIMSREEAMDIPPEKNITPQAKPTNLEELTQKLDSSVPVAPIEVESSAAGQANESITDKPAEETKASEAQPAADTGDSDKQAMAALAAQLMECKYVADVNKFRNSLIGPASKLDETQKKRISQLCDERVAEIKKQRDSKQSTLPTS